MEVMLAVGFSLIAGTGLGYVFFWGLWKTVEKMPSVKNPYLWMFASFSFRTAVVLLGFYLLLQIQWQLIAVALLGFISARFVVTRYTIKKSKNSV